VCAGWVLGHDLLKDVKVFRVVASLLLCRYYSVLGGCYDVLDGGFLPLSMSNRDASLMFHTI